MLFKSVIDHIVNFDVMKTENDFLMVKVWELGWEHDITIDITGEAQTKLP